MARFGALVLMLSAVPAPALAQEIPTTSGEGILSGSERGADGTASDAASMTVEYQRRYLNSGGKVRLNEKDPNPESVSVNPDPTGELAAVADRRRGDAIALAARVKGGAAVPAELAAKLRQSLDDDLTLWIRQFAVNPVEAARAREKWLPSVESRNAQQWILDRAAWYEARDQWIATTRQTAAR